MLQHYPILRTRDTAAVVSLIESTAGVRMQHVGRIDSAGCDVSGLWLKRLSLASIRYGFPAAIAAGNNMDSHIISFPLRGDLAVDAADRRALIRPGACVAMSPTVPLSLTADAMTHRIVMRVSVDALSRHFAMLTADARESHPIEFDIAAVPRGDNVDLLLRQIQLAIVLLDTRPRGQIMEDALDEIESAILTTLLLSQRHSRSAALNGRPERASPRAVRAVVDYIHANAHRGITVEELAAAAGMSGRSMYRQFHAAKRLGPLAYLRETRFARARADLDAAASGDTVEIIARRWGFHHTGRFAGEYRRRYGKSPSTTLKGVG